MAFNAVKSNHLASLGLKGLMICMRVCLVNDAVCINANKQPQMRIFVAGSVDECGRLTQPAYSWLLGSPY